MTPAMGQLASAGLGHFPDDPLRCGLNSSKPHTDASATRRSSPNSSWNRHGVAFLLFGFLTFYSVKFPGLPSCGRCATVGWVGAQFSFSFFSTIDAASCSLRCSSLFTQTSRCRGARHAGVAFAALGPVSTVYRACGGAACCCWLGNLPYDPCHGAACLCWFRAFSR